MPSLDTTNWILGVMAATSAAQFLMLIVGAIWVARRVAAFRIRSPKRSRDSKPTICPSCQRGSPGSSRT